MTGDFKYTTTKRKLYILGENAIAKALFSLKNRFHFLLLCFCCFTNQ